MNGRLYEVRLQGSSESITVVVPLNDDYYKESHEAVMFARSIADKWLSHRMLNGCERGPLVTLAKRLSG